MTAAAPEKEPAGRAALLIVDMINDFDFFGGDRLLDRLGPVVEVIANLRDDADKARLPVIYVNDNYDQWHSDRERIVESCMEKKAAAREVIKRLGARDHGSQHVRRDRGIRRHRSGALAGAGVGLQARPVRNGRRSNIFRSPPSGASAGNSSSM